MIRGTLYNGCLLRPVHFRGNRKWLPHFTFNHRVKGSIPLANVTFSDGQSTGCFHLDGPTLFEVIDPVNLENK